MSRAKNSLVASRAIWRADVASERFAAAQNHRVEVDEVPSEEFVSVNSTCATMFRHPWKHLKVNGQSATWKGRSKGTRGKEIYFLETHRAPVERGTTWKGRSRVTVERKRPFCHKADVERKSAPFRPSGTRGKEIAGRRRAGGSPWKGNPPARHPGRRSSRQR